MSGTKIRKSEEQLPVDALGRLVPDDVRLAKSASRQVLGVMNEMAFECGWHVDQAGGLWNINAGAHSIATCAGACTPKTGQYGVPLELVHERL